MTPHPPQPGSNGSPSMAGASAHGIDPQRPDPWRAIEHLPRTSWLPALVCGVGRFDARLPEAGRWLSALAAGALPGSDADFADPAATQALRTAVAELRLPAICEGLPLLAEQVLRMALWHLDRIADRQAHEDDRPQAIAAAVQAFRDEWEERRLALEPQLAVLRALGDDALAAWDATPGAQRALQWEPLRRAAADLQRLPSIQELIDRLGRRDPGPAAPSVAPPDPISGPRPARAVASTVEAPGEIVGVRFGARIEAMLPSEAVLLHHPTGRRLWRARQAEGRLLSHATRQTLWHWQRAERADAAVTLARRAEPAARRGPILVCLDTSGSMRGAPGHVARAAVLAVAASARAQQRACSVIAFGASGEVCEREIGPGPAGMAGLQAVLSQAFDGGTDVQTPIEWAASRLDQARWHGADLLIVSDGEFGCMRSTVELLDWHRQQRALHVQGVLVGDRETIGMLEACDQILWLRHWRQFADDPARRQQPQSVLGSHRMTARMFPQALSESARRRHGLVG